MNLEQLNKEFGNFVADKENNNLYIENPQHYHLLEDLFFTELDMEHHLCGYITDSFAYSSFRVYIEGKTFKDILITGSEFHVANEISCWSSCLNKDSIPTKELINNFSTGTVELDFLERITPFYDSKNLSEQEVAFIFLAFQQFKLREKFVLIYHEELKKHAENLINRFLRTVNTTYKIENGQLEIFVIDSLGYRSKIPIQDTFFSYQKLEEGFK